MHIQLQLALFTKMTYLHAIKSLAVPLSPPLPSVLAAPELHEDHVPIPPLGSNHSKVADNIPGLFPDKA